MLATVPPKMVSGMIRPLHPGFCLKVPGGWPRGRTATRAYFGSVSDAPSLLAGSVPGRSLQVFFPPFVHVPSGSTEAELVTWRVPQLLREMRAPGLGHLTAVGHLFSLMFLQVLRVHMARQKLGGWFVGLTTVVCRAP